MATPDGKLTKQLLKTKSGEFDVESIHSLVLRATGLTELGPIGECSALERLDLSQNNLSRLHALASLTMLTHLNLSANRISSLEGLQTLDNLISLNLSGNLIGSADTLRCLASLEKLTDLRLQDTVKDLSNPLCLGTNYKTDVLHVLPNLTTLDGVRLSGKGSEVYKMCEDIDRLLAGSLKISATDVKTSKKKVIPTEELPDAGPWVPPDFWERKMVASFENSALADAQTELETLLVESLRMNAEAGEKINKHRESLIQQPKTSDS